MAWQMGLPIPFPPWTATTLFDRLWLPLTEREACTFLKYEVKVLKQWPKLYEVPVQERCGRKGKQHALNVGALQLIREDLARGVNCVQRRF